MHTQDSGDERPAGLLPEGAPEGAGAPSHEPALLPGVAPVPLPGSAIDRRHVLSLAGLGLLGGVLAACGGGDEVVVPERVDSKEVTHKEGKERLTSGNERYVHGTPAHPDQTLTRRKKLGEGQKPFCAVLSCADSRVPPEIVFDQGLGDLFVVRSAGQVVDDAVLGSLQFGVAEIGIPLLVVLGHTKCGAVGATVEHIEKKKGPTGTSIDALVAAITPAVREAEEAGIESADLAAAVVEFNVDRVVKQLEKSKILMAAEKKRELKILGAVYDVETGEVDFL
ncbi:carbonic anhydrase [Kineosporia sp. A_224]|uniref:carbonic anhydrase n=1 Tax=Kineosporia sp. A_224 TaxID=1962180 RepID=UPI000B4B4C7D|nr:carbonic anhydrase [Kineosporia sp. A_224]